MCSHDHQSCSTSHSLHLTVSRNTSILEEPGLFTLLSPCTTSIVTSRMSFVASLIDPKVTAITRSRSLRCQLLPPHFLHHYLFPYRMIPYLKTPVAPILTTPMPFITSSAALHRFVATKQPLLHQAMSPLHVPLLIETSNLVLIALKSDLRRQLRSLSVTSASNCPRPG
jgi:hypothetical protein